MVEQLADMPAGTVGFRISGKITSGEYHLMLDPVREAIQSGTGIRLLIETADDFHGLDLGALWQDVKAAGSVGIGHHGEWKRTAVVTDKDWMRHAVAGFGWLSPGELKVFEPGELGEAKAWLVADAAPATG